MDYELLKEIKNKENKSEAEIALLAYHKCFANISEVLVTESKLDISSEQAVQKIRKLMSEVL